MRKASVLFFALLLAPALPAADRPARLAPDYSSTTILNSASNLPGPFAPNTIVSLYGENLSLLTRAIASEDVRNGQLPTLLPGTGVRVVVGKIPAQIYFVSPYQVNLLIPATLIPGPAELQLFLDGKAGPSVPMTLAVAAPALYLQGYGVAIATRPDASLVTRQQPARPGDILILYATGLGETFPPAGYGEIAREATPLVRMDQFQIWLDSIPIPSSDILYAGLAPGFAGLYQINLRLPPQTGTDPEIRLIVGSIASPTEVRIPVQP